VVGTNKRERFEVNRLNDNETEVKVYQTNKKDSMGTLTYQRVFKINETEELRLYGLGGDDRFIITGEVNKSIKARVIGGKGEDEIFDNSKVNRGKSIIAYDNKKGMTIESKGEVKDKTSDRDRSVNVYNRLEFKYDKILPQIYGGFTPDDGIFFGGGASFLKQKFRKEPFGRKHTILAAVAPKSGSFNLKYSSEYTDAIGKWDLLLDADFFAPGFADFFYGLGNKTALDEEARDTDSQFYRARYQNGRVGLGIRNTSKNEIHSIGFGTYFRTVNIGTKDNVDEDEPNRFIIQYADSIGRGNDAPSPLLDFRRNYIGGTVNYTLDTRNSEIFPTRGIIWNLGARAVWQIEDETNSYQNINSNIATYFSFGGSLRTTIALRAGGSANFGDFEFYQAPRLGGFATLRGYRRSRFAEDQTFYQNTDIRIRLMEYKTPLFPGSFGITLIHDIGRVWTDNEDEFLIDEEKAKWHRGYGGGIWISPLGQAVISLDYTKSNDDEEGIFIRLGVFF
jgi:outer membrane protein assembly factor BamA